MSSDSLASLSIFRIRARRNRLVDPHVGGGLRRERKRSRAHPGDAVATSVGSVLREESLTTLRGVGDRGAARKRERCKMPRDELVPVGPSEVVDGFSAHP